jgi:hypothetical protein
MSDIAHVASRVNNESPAGEQPVAQGRQLWGAGEIGSVIRRSPRQAHYMLKAGRIKCAQKKGSLWTANETALLREFGAEV